MGHVTSGVYGSCDLSPMIYTNHVITPLSNPHAWHSLGAGGVLTESMVAKNSRLPVYKLFKETAQIPL